MMSNNNRYHEGELSDIEIDGLSIGSTDSEATFANAAVRRTPKRLEPSLNNGPSWLSMPLDTQDFYASLPPVGPLFPDADIRQYHTFTSGSSNENQQQPPRSRTGSVTSTTSGRLRSQRSISPKRKREQGLHFSRMETSSPPGDVSPVSPSSRGSRRGSVVAPSKPFEVADLEAVTHLLGIKRRSFSPLTPNTTAALAPQPIATSKPASPRGAKSTTPSMIITLQPVSGGAVRQVPLNTKPTADPELELRRFQGLASMLYKRKTSSASQAPSLSGEDSSTEMR